MNTPRNDHYIRLQPKGLITIPKKMRDQLRLNQQSILRISQQGQQLILEPITILDYPVRQYNDQEVQEFLAYDRLETKKDQPKLN